MDSGSTLAIKQFHHCLMNGKLQMDFILGGVRVMRIDCDLKVSYWKRLLLAMRTLKTIFSINWTILENKIKEKQMEVKMTKETEQELMLGEYVGAVEFERVSAEINDAARDLVTSLDPRIFNITKAPEVSISEQIRLTRESLLAAYLSGYEDCERVHCAQSE